MATFRKRGATWRAEVNRAGVRESATFATKAAAQAWAAKVESEIMSGKHEPFADKTFGQLLEKYRDEVSAKKNGEHWERIRIDRLVYGRPDNAPPIAPEPFCAIRLADLDSPHFAEWRDRRLKQVTPASVRREWNLLSAAINVAINEWRWLPKNPMKSVKRPEGGPARDRRISDDEVERLLFALGYDPATTPETKTARVGAAFLFAIETAMRVGEIAALMWRDVSIESRVATVTAEAKGAGKTAAARRRVALSAEAVRILQQLEPLKGGGQPVFGVPSNSIDALFRKCTARAMIEDLHFHDTRHEAITRLAKKLDVLDLARMVGHRDLRQLMVYYNADAADIAKRL